MEEKSVLALNDVLTVPPALIGGECPIRMAGTHDVPLFSLADVCRVLGISNPSMVADRIDDDDKRMINLNTLSQAEGIRGNPNTTFVTEGGLYTVLLRSDKPQAKPFRKWVTGEVLPSIRRFGCYPPPADAQDHILSEIHTIQHTLRMAAETRKAQLELDRRQGQLEQAIDRVETIAVAARERADSNYGLCSILGWLRLQRRNATATEASQLGRQAAAMCRAAGIEVPKVRDPRWGEVGVYPEHVLERLLGPARPHDN